MRGALPLLRAAGSHRASLALALAAAAIVLAGLAGMLEIAEWIWLPGLGLAASLLAACVAVPALRACPWLFAFHALLAVLVVAAMADWLTGFRGRVEISEGAAFAPGLVEREAGPLHRDRLDRVRFVQGGFEIGYAPGMKRRETRSTVLLPDGRGGWRPVEVGDETPLVAAGYRFYTTHNKGFAPVLGFTDRAGRQTGGTVHMPSYPLNSHAQANSWTPPGGAPLMLWLSLAEPVYDEDGAWDFALPRAATLVVAREGLRAELAPGEAVDLPEGRLAWEGLRVWMGYTVVSHSLAPWLMALALAAGACLAAHVAGGRLPARPFPADRSGELADGR